MNKLLLIRLQFRINELLSQTKRHQSAYVVLTSENGYYLAMLIDNNNFVKNQIKFVLVKNLVVGEKYVMKVSNHTINVNPVSTIQHITDEFGEEIDLIGRFDLTNTNCTRFEFEKHFNNYFKKKQQLHVKKSLQIVEEIPKTSKHISSYEKHPDSVLKHLVEPKTAHERHIAKIEREIFNNPKMWQFKL